METTEKRSFMRGIRPADVLRRVSLCLSLLWMGFYFCFRGRRDWMNALFRAVVHPWHDAAGRITSSVSFSLAEWIIALWVLTVLCFAARLCVFPIRRRGAKDLLRRAEALITLAAVLFGLFCLWWGVCYYTDSFSERAGLERRAVSNDELALAAEYYAGLANEYSLRVARDGSGLFTADLGAVFDRSEILYHAVEREYPCLKGPDLRAKPAVFSRIMSFMNNTGYFFCFTAEANVNTDCPLALLPATVAHELAHQRGVAGEDEANYVAVAACMADGDPVFVYSGALMAYVYLGNALHGADYERWLKVYDSLNENVRLDLRAHNAYWARYDTPVADVSDRVYEQVLRTYGDDRGMKSYDACVDLLTVYCPDRA